jgi:hypothetical protein
MTTKILGTFKALVAAADFESDSLLKEEADGVAAQEKKIDKEKEQEEASFLNAGRGFQGMRPEFHYNIQIHLPSNGSEETYMNIFNAIRKVFK